MISERGGDWLDGQLDRLTTYKLIFYLLCIYLAAGIGFGFAGRLGFSGWSLIVSSAWLLAVCRAVNWSLSRYFKVPRNHESDMVTALILSLIMTPAVDTHGFFILAAAGAAAMVSKYVLTVQKRHVFNPAAFGAFTAGILFHDYASWWVGSSDLAIFAILGGLLILRKMKRFQMAGAFMLIYLVYLIWHSPLNVATHEIRLLLLSTPTVFLATVMLTEPLTSPTSLNKSLVYAAIVGLLYSFNNLRFTPEEALLLGNIATLVMVPSRSVILSFIGQAKEAEGIYSFRFHSPQKLKFKAGQYMEWTLPGVVADGRGNRRYLTIASPPTDPELMFTIKVPAHSSSFKNSLMRLKPGDQILAAQLAGDFVLPPKRNLKLAFMAGGVGITPFHSMIKETMQTSRKLDAHLFYSVNKPEEAAYRQLFNHARGIGLTTHVVVANAPADWRGLSGFINETMIKDNLPDFAERLFYVSGPQAFVAAIRQTLLKLGVPGAQIKTDFFPGYN